MSAVRIGILLDEFGRPMRSVLRDEGPGRGRTSAHAAATTPAYQGTIVQGISGDGRDQAIQRQAARRRRRAS